MATEKFKCHNCPACTGLGCTGEMPGMGGVRNNENFKLNCSAWSICREILQTVPDFPTNKGIVSQPDKAERKQLLRLAPVTGAVENVGFPDEQEFYYDLIFSAYEAGIGLCIGDGCPDIKLRSGIGAVELLQKSHPDARAAVFIKPYEDRKFYERMEWAKNAAEIIGIDIDSYNIITMRNLVHLEQKSTFQLEQIRRRTSVPFAMKGIFMAADVQLVREVKPDIVYISNHGGRVDTRRGSTAEFLMQYGRLLAQNCGEIWVDGGIRTPADIQTAVSLGASTVLAGRPFISALCKGGTAELCRKADEMTCFHP